MENNLLSKPSMLIVDDEQDILFILKRCFAANNYSIETAINGAEAIQKINQHSYQIMLLDLNMSPINGLEVLDTLRKINQETIVIILTAYSTLDSAINAIRLGAFDYMVKPVDVDALRVRAAEGLKQYERNHLLTLQQAAGDGQILQTGKLTLNLALHSAFFDGKPVELTTTEFKILLCLVQAAPHPVQPAQLVKTALGYSCSALEAADIIKFHIHHLRQKIEPDPLKPQHIKTIRFEGYLWCS
jgi:DNA-binding response OmpR family regulator